MTTRKKAPTIEDPAEAERFYNRLRARKRTPGDADVDATEATMTKAMRKHAAATLRALADEHETPPGADWRPDEVGAWVAARAYLAGGES